MVGRFFVALSCDLFRLVTLRNRTSENECVGLRLLISEASEFADLGAYHHRHIMDWTDRLLLHWWLVSQVPIPGETLGRPSWAKRR
jgi:hypothetical protein